MKIVQRKDTLIKGHVSEAFAEVRFVLQTYHHGEVEVILDMESAITVLKQMDDGERAIKEIENERP